MHLAQLQKNHTQCSPSGLPILEKPRVYFMVGDPWALKPQKSPSKSIVSLPHTLLLLIPHLGLCQVSNGDRHTFQVTFPELVWGASLPVLIQAVL